MDVLEAIRVRRSVRQYDKRPIPDEKLNQVLESLRLAPSACNYQPWRFILVTDEDIKNQLVDAANGQSFIADAPVIVVGCGFEEDAYPRMAGSRSAVEIDVAIALDHLTLAAVEAGLGTCWIGAFSESKVKDILGVPDSVRVVALTPLGYPKSPKLIFPVDESRRKKREEVFSRNKFA